MGRWNGGGVGGGDFKMKILWGLMDGRQAGVWEVDRGG